MQKFTNHAVPPNKTAAWLPFVPPGVVCWMVGGRGELETGGGGVVDHCVGEVWMPSARGLDDWR